MGQERMNARSDVTTDKSKASKDGRDLFDVENSKDMLPGMTGTRNREWGKLRAQRTQDAVEGRRDEYDPEFEELIKAYYRGLGSGAR